VGRWPLSELAAALIEPADAAERTPADHRRAAVAILLREGAAEGAELEVLLMLRAERDDDRWSGQVSLPGGHAEEGDSGLEATAARETEEEVGLDPALCAELLGAMPPLQARAGGGPVALSISPLVYRLRAEHPEPQPGPEASAVFWFPLERAAAGELDGEYHYDAGGPDDARLPAWCHEGWVIWGLTYRILTSLIEILEPR